MRAQTHARTHRHMHMHTPPPPPPQRTNIHSYVCTLNMLRFQASTRDTNVKSPRSDYIMSCVFVKLHSPQIIYRIRRILYACISSSLACHQPIVRTTRVHPRRLGPRRTTLDDHGCASCWLLDWTNACMLPGSTGGLVGGEMDG